MTQGGPVCRTPHTYERKLSTSKLRYKGGGNVYHRQDEKELNGDPGGDASGARNSDGNPNSPQAVVFLTSVVDVTVGY